jgi:FkbM family methyltransferase
MPRVNDRGSRPEQHPSDQLADRDGRVALLAQARGESVSTVLARFSPAQLERIPPRFKHVDRVRRLDIAEAGIEEGVAFVRLGDGSIFYGFPSRPSHARQFEFVRDLISDRITPETYLLALDLAARHVKDPIAVLPEPGGRMVEVGAYLGHKTVRYVQNAMGGSGRVLAIEMIPDNVELLRRNVRVNGLDEVITVAPFGVWNRETVVRVTGVGRQRNSLLDLDGLRDELNVEVPTKTLDQLLDAWGEERCDFMLITVNGAEVEALEGLHRWAPRVRVIRINAGRTRGGERTRDRCIELLEDRGFGLLSCAGDMTLYAAQSDAVPLIEAALQRDSRRATPGWRRP